MRKTLEDLGWYLYSQCSCGGTHRQQFKSNRFPDWEIEVATSKESFIIKRNNISKCSGKGEQLEIKMREHGIF